MGAVAEDCDIICTTHTHVNLELKVRIFTALQGGDVHTAVEGQAGGRGVPGDGI